MCSQQHLRNAFAFISYYHPLSPSKIFLPIFLTSLCQGIHTCTNMHVYYQSCIKYFQKVFQLQITFLSIFCQLLWTSSPKYKTILKVLTKLIELKNTFV